MASICVIGLGRIGLPLALLLAKANHRVFGVDADSRTRQNINSRNPELPNANIERTLLEEYLGKSFFVTRDMHAALRESDAVFVAIGTSINHDGTPDLSNLFDLVEDMCASPDEIRERLFVIKSTLPLGTTRKIVAKMEERTGLKCGKDFFVAFCPERVLGDKAISEMASLPKIIGGMDQNSSKRATTLYKTIGGKLIIVDRPEIAELVKLADNAYRQTLFAFANDLAILADEHGISAYELIKTANDNYPRNNIPFPSAGVSGYCLTKDPLYLESSFKEISLKRGFHSVWHSARKTNDYMPVHMVNLLRNKLKSLGKDLKGSSVLVCGISYKENTDDTRCSHGLEIASRLRDEGANVHLWDPQVHKRDLGFHVVDSPDEVLETLDALVFTVKHREFVQLNHNDAILRMVAKMRTPVIVDGWGIFLRLAGRNDVFYAGVGVG